MLLGWESTCNTSIWQKSAKLEGGNLSLGGGKSQVPHPLYEALDAEMQGWRVNCLWPDKARAAVFKPTHKFLYLICGESVITNAIYTR